MAAGRGSTADRWLVRRWRLARKRSRFMICAAIFIVLAVTLSWARFRPEVAILLAFDVAAVLFLGSTIVMIVRSDSHSIRHRARKEDEGYWGFLLGSAAVATIALVALAAELHASKHAGSLEIALAVCSVVLAWLFMNTIFALHYAHEFYGESGGKHAGLEFPGRSEPDYWDFVYFAFVLGMTSRCPTCRSAKRRFGASRWSTA